VTVKAAIKGLLVIASCLLLVTGLAHGIAVAQANGSGTPELYFVDDVIEQFVALPERADALGFGIGVSTGASLKKHYQGIARSHGPGVPYFFITRNADVGRLLIVKMGSRPTHGERLRSNRLRKDMHVDDTPPDDGDEIIVEIKFNGEDKDSGGTVWPNYEHPGGVQLIGDVLVVPLEAPNDPSNDPKKKVLFLDVSNPEDPVILGELVHEKMKEAWFEAAVVGITKLPINEHYLLLVTGGDNSVLYIFESRFTDFADFNGDEDDWRFVDVWTEEDDEDDLGSGHDWPTAAPYQSLNFVRQDDLYGPLYLIGITNKGAGGGGAGIDEDRIDLFNVNISAGNEFTLKFKERKDVIAKSTFGGGDLANFAAASGVYVSPTGELIVYGTEHDNDGPEDSIKAGEWRHHDMVRTGSPTYNPTPEAGGPFEVDEGAEITLQGQANPAITKAWIELFSDPDWTDRSLVIDYDDYEKEDFDDFKDLNFSDKTSSWRWFAPVSCTIRVNDDDFEDSNFPGKHTKSLLGNGLVNTAADLKDVQNNRNDGDMDDELTSMQFFSNCDTYYDTSTNYELSWDLDQDGFFETFGETPLYSAAGLDGPDVIMLPIRATHLPDTLPGTSAAQVNVINVAPVIESLSITDFAGRELGVDVLTAPTYLRIWAEGLFTDAGTPDTQTATLDWGDGTMEPSTTFDQFNDANGGITGRVRHSHIYTSAGIYNVVLTVVDDDGGQTQSTRQIEIVAAQGGGGGGLCSLGPKSASAWMAGDLWLLLAFISGLGLWGTRRRKDAVK
jgi:hypothetical protein